MGDSTGILLINLFWLCRCPLPDVKNVGYLIYLYILVSASDQTVVGQIPKWKAALWVAVAVAECWLKGGAGAKGGSKVMQGEVRSGRAPNRPTLELH